MSERLEGPGDLPREADPGRDLWPEIAAEIARGERAAASPPDAAVQMAGPPTSRWAQPDFWRRAAAAAVIFASGGLGGWALSRPSEPSARASVDEALALAAEVQRTGSEYVAALAAFAAAVDSLSGEVRSQGRDAAVATLYGATRELVALQAASGAAPPTGEGSSAPIRF